MTTAVGFIMLAIICVALISGKVTVIPVFTLVPILAALILGYGVRDITGFMNDGFASVLNTVILFAFAVMYFSLLSEVGMFDVIVKNVMRFLGNNVLAVLYVAAFVTIISHLDGSGGTTALVTIPMMLPIFKKMKIRPIAVVCILTLLSGAMNITPWCASMLRMSSVSGVDAQELWRYLLPIQGFAIVAALLMMIPMAASEKKNGAGMTEAEFAEMKASLNQPAEISVSRPILIFDIVLTVILIISLLLGWVGTAFGFMVGFGIIVLVNFRGLRAQNDMIRKHGGPALNMVATIISIGVLVGIMNNTGMIDGMTDAILGILPESLGQHLTALVSALIVPINTVIGSDNVYFALTPIMMNITAAYGVPTIALATSIVVPCALGAGITLIGPSPYLALGLADCTMGEHLKYSFKYVWLLGLLCTAFGCIIGKIPL